jgi:hypothetical protein
MGKTRKVRKAPVESATSLPEGTIKGSWVIKKASNGVPRWMPARSVELNGFRLFTVDLAAKQIGKPVTLFCREYKETWPSKNAWSKRADSTYMKYTFVPNGDALKGKTRIPGWLRTRKVAVPKGSHFYLDGPLYEGAMSKSNYLADSIPVNSGDGKVVSVDLMGTETFVKV